MVAGRLGKNPRPMHDASPFRVLGSESQRLDSCQGDRGSAHRARLESDPQGTIVEPGRAELHCRGPDRFNFCMSGWIERSPHCISGLGHDLIVSADDGSNRDFAIGGGLSREVERPAHR